MTTTDEDDARRTEPKLPTREEVDKFFADYEEWERSQSTQPDSSAVPQPSPKKPKKSKLKSTLRPRHYPPMESDESFRQRMIDESSRGDGRGDGTRRFGAAIMIRASAPLTDLVALYKSLRTLSNKHRTYYSLSQFEINTKHFSRRLMYPQTRCYQMEFFVSHSASPEQLSAFRKGLVNATARYKKKHVTEDILITREEHRLCEGVECDLDDYE